MEQEKNMQVNVEKDPDKKNVDFGELIGIEVRSVEIPASEYRRLIDAESKLNMVARAYCHNRYDSDLKHFIKIALSEEIMKWTEVLKVKSPEEDDE